MTAEPSLKAYSKELWASWSITSDCRKLQMKKNHTHASDNEEDLSIVLTDDEEEED